MKNDAPNASSPKRTPLYLQLVSELRAELARKLPGDRLGTESDYARRFSVSVFTVRQALQVLGNEGLIEKRQGSGSYIAERPQGQKHVALLMNVDLSSPNLSPYYLHSLYLMRGALSSRGISHRTYLGNLPLGSLPGPLAECPELYEDAALNRLSCVYGVFTGRGLGWRAPFDQRGIPVYDRWRDHDEQKQPAIHAAFSYFRERGRHRIAAIGWQHPHDGSEAFRDPLHRAAEEYGLTLDEVFIACDANGWEPGMGWERLRDIWRSSSVKPDALFIGDEMIYADCQRAILELGISVPDQLAVALKSSDIFPPFEVAFPVMVWKDNVKDTMECAAEGIGAILRGEPQPLTIHRHHIEMLYPQAEETPETTPFSLT